MRDIVERLKEKIIVDLFVSGSISDGVLCDRLIRERLDAADEIERLRKRLAEADEANRRVSDENQRMRQSVKEYLSNLARVTNDMLREMWEREVGNE